MRVTKRKASEWDEKMLRGRTCAWRALKENGFGAICLIAFHSRPFGDFIIHLWMEEGQDNGAFHLRFDFLISTWSRNKKKGEREGVVGEREEREEVRG
jgi:hypothetical protein